MEHSVRENAIAGNLMDIREIYMCVNLLTKGEVGSLGSGLGTTTARGTIGILDATAIMSSKEE